MTWTTGRGGGAGGIGVGAGDGACARATLGGSTPARTRLATRTAVGGSIAASVIAASFRIPSASLGLPGEILWPVLPDKEKLQGTNVKDQTQLEEFINRGPALPALGPLDDIVTVVAYGPGHLSCADPKNLANLSQPPAKPNLKLLLILIDEIEPPCPVIFPRPAAPPFRRGRLKAWVAHFFPALASRSLSARSIFSASRAWILSDISSTLLEASTPIVAALASCLERLVFSVFRP